MSQDRLIKLVSVGDENGVGKGHVYYTSKNKKGVERKIELKKYNPVARKQTLYKESKK
ncbi:MAG: 50S ribosomal protein L33 [Parcubacteria group bacterium]|nr:50S ribosomal protein L33 [Parcubacteria group bacterium]